MLRNRCAVSAPGATGVLDDLGLAAAIEWQLKRGGENFGFSRQKLAFQYIANKIRVALHLHLQQASAAVSTNGLYAHMRTSAISVSDLPEAIIRITSNSRRRAVDVAP